MGFDAALAARLADDAGVTLYSYEAARFVECIVALVRAGTDDATLRACDQDNWAPKLSDIARAATPSAAAECIALALALSLDDDLDPPCLADHTAPELDVDVASWRWVFCVAYYLADRLVIQLGLRPEHED